MPAVNILSSTMLHDVFSPAEILDGFDPDGTVDVDGNQTEYGICQCCNHVISMNHITSLPYDTYCPDCGGIVDFAWAKSEEFYPNAVTTRRHHS